MAKKPSPNAKTNFPADGPAYVSWAGTKAEQSRNLEIYTQAIQEAATASQGPGAQGECPRGPHGRSLCHGG